MRSGTWISPFLALAVAWAFPLPSVRACEAGTCLQQVWPQDGADDVPTNARIWIHYDVAGTFGVEATLRDGDGAEVAVTEELWEGGRLELVFPWLLVLTPEQALTAGEEYTLDLAPEVNVCEEPEPIEFTTAAGADAVVPEFGGIQSIVAWFIEGAPANGPCDVGPDRHHYEVAGAESSDAVAYLLYEDGEQVAVSRSPTLVSQVEGTGEAPNRCFVMHAVDMAGNEDPNDDVLCLHPVGDDDDSAGDDDPVADDCACRVADCAGVATWIPLVLLGLVLAWRGRYLG